MTNAILKLLFILILACQLNHLFLFAKEAESKPNFLFILIDDQPFDAFGHFGRYPFLETPHLDRLAEEGVTFSNFFCTASLCSPSRASFLTSTFPHIHGVNQNHPQVDPDWEKFPPYTQELQSAGYQTAMVGKIHMAHKAGKDHIRPGFDYWLSFNGQGDFFDPQLNENGKEFQEDGYITDVLTDYTVDWLENKRNPDKPFNLLFWHKAVHEPYEPAPRHDGAFQNTPLPEPPHGTARETFLGKPEWQRIKAFDSKWQEYEPVDQLPEKPWDPYNRRYQKLLECVLSIDESVGRVLKTLEKLNLLENTVVIFSSDNGYFMGEHTYWDKRIAYEPSMKIPLLIRYPSLIKPGSDIDALCMNIDMAPTILELAGVEIPKHYQGESMLSLLSNSQADWRDSVFFQYYVDDVYPYAGPDMIAVRTKRYKWIDAFLENDIDELYDLKEDPGEMHNLINDPEHQEVLEKMQKEGERLKALYTYNSDRDWWLRQVVSEESPEIEVDAKLFNEG